METFLISLFMATLVSLFFTATARRAFIWYGVNSLVLGATALYLGHTLAEEALLVSGTLTLVLKGFMIPWVLIRTAEHFGLKRYLRAEIPLTHNIVLIPALMVFSWYLVSPLGQNATQQSMALSIAALLLALLYMVEHRHLAAKIAGFLVLENSLFLLGTTATQGMPMLVELGIFFDLMMAVVVVNLLLVRGART